MMMMLMMMISIKDLMFLHQTRALVFFSHASDFHCFLDFVCMLSMII